MTVVSEEDYLAHYGILRRSGRYPWGSGGPESASSKGFLDYVDSLRKQGLSETEIARGMGTTTTQLRAAKAIALNEKKQADIGMAQRLKDKGYSNGAIAERMGLAGESSVRALLAPGAKDKAAILTATSNMLREQVEKKTYLDVGAGAESHLGISDTKLKNAVAMLQEDGYKLHYVKVQQLGTNHETTLKILTKDDVTYSEVFKNKGNIQQITDVSDNGGRSFYGLKPPLNISSSRVSVKYGPEGGAEADGVIYVRPGVKDISLGAARYSQVRVAIDGTHYLKGMAMYKDDLPAGVDLVFNTNKTNTGNKLDAMKELKRDKDGNVDQDNPFGAIVKQLGEHDSSGKLTKVTSAMNVVNEEGDWDKWKKSLSAQMLSKQSPALAKAQLAVALEKKQAAFDEIKNLTNPAVRKKLLESFADDVDSSSVQLDAASLPRQASHVILPLKSLKEGEIFAPNYKDGEKVVLVRYPHGGTFEIPELTVNNKNAEGKTSIGSDAPDAVGIHPKVAQRLSGADFDGDSVLVIPNNKGEIKTSPALKGLENFDPQREYPAYEGMPKISGHTKQHLMGETTNLIADMTIRGANNSELARAVRHSMVVIDAEKHNLNYKQSAKDNGIANLKAKYQTPYNATGKSGASTLVTRAGSEVRVAERKQGYKIDPVTGKKIFSETGGSFVDKNGKLVIKTTTSKKLAETDDANTLSSGTTIEKIYATHSNALKAMANEARRELVSTKTTPYSPSAKATYASEVASLNAKLNRALKNRPLERQAQILANTTVSMKRAAYPDMSASDLKKVKAQALNEARARTGAGKELIDITPEEWAAIQAGAISNNKLTQIISNTDVDKLKQLATPRTNTVMTDAKLLRAKQMLASGYTQAAVAEALGVAVSTLKSSVAVNS